MTSRRGVLLQVGGGVPTVTNTSEGLLQASLDLRLRLTEAHFAAGRDKERERDRDAVRLRCNAEVPHLAIHNQYLKLARRTRQPVPARGMVWSARAVEDRQPAAPPCVLFA